MGAHASRSEMARPTQFGSRAASTASRARRFGSPMAPLVALMLVALVVPQAVLGSATAGADPAAEAAAQSGIKMTALGGRSVRGTHHVMGEAARRPSLPITGPAWTPPGRGLAA